MINPDFLFSFLIASFLMAVAPGPSNAFLMAQTFANGRTAGMQSAFGFALGGVVHTFFENIKKRCSICRCSLFVLFGLYDDKKHAKKHDYCHSNSK